MAPAAGGRAPAAAAQPGLCLYICAAHGAAAPAEISNIRTAGRRGPDVRPDGSVAAPRRRRPRLSAAGPPSRVRAAAGARAARRLTRSFVGRASIAGVWRIFGGRLG